MAGDAVEGGASQGHQQAPFRLLVAMADRDAGGMLAFHLRREGLVVVLSTSEEEAIDAVAWAPPDALLVEINGEDLDGFRISKAVADKDVAIFACVQGAISGDHELELLRLGVVDVFPEPLDAAMIATRVRQRAHLRGGRATGPLAEGAISGDLEVHPLIHLLELCLRHRLNAKIHVELDGDWAVLLVREGAVIDAAAPDATARAAVTEALQRAAGKYVLFPLAADAAELSRDDIVLADLATLAQDAMAPTSDPSDSTTTAGDGPLEPRTHRPKSAKPDTMEYLATPSEAPTGRRDRPRIRRQVGVPQPQPHSERTDRRDEPTIVAKAVSARSGTDEIFGALVHVGGRDLTAKPSTGEGTGRRRTTQPGAAAAVRAVTQVDVEAAKPAPEPVVVESVAVRPEPDIVGVPSEPREDAEAGTDAGRDAASQAITDGVKAAFSQAKGADAAAPSEDSLPHEPPVDEATDQSASNPMVAKPRVRRPTTGMFDIGDARAPAEVTNVDVDKRAARRRAQHRHGAGGGLHPGVVMLGIVLLAAVAIVVIRLAGSEAPPKAPPQTLAPAVAQRVALGEAILAVEAGKLEAGAAQLQALVDTDVHADEALSALAHVHHQRGDLAAADRALSSLTARRQDDVRAWAYLGLVRALREQPDGADQAFDRARSLAPRGGDLHRALGQLLEARPVPPTAATGVDGTADAARGAP